MRTYIARAGHGRIGRHPLTLSLAAALMLATPRSGMAEIGSGSPQAVDRVRADRAAQIGLHFPGALRQRERHVPDRPAGTIVVGNCADSGAGSLREALATAVSGDVVDLTQLDCSTITLSSGGIIAAVDEIELIGPAASALTIDAAYHGRAFYHLGDATFSLTGLRLTRGAYSGGPYYHAFGGCVLSQGTIEADDSIIDHCGVADSVTDNYGTAGGCLLAYVSVTLTDSTVSACEVTATSDDAAVGGAIFAARDVVLLRSRISGSTVTGAQGEAAAGGAMAIEDLVMKYSTISDNGAVSGYVSRAGGIYVQGNSYVSASTISGNHADFGGGLWMSGSSATSPATIQNSTISGNVGDVAFGGIIASIPLILANSTVAFNTSVTLNVGGLYVGYDTELQSSIIAHNNASSAQRDVGGSDSAMVTGANNLVGVTFLTLPSDTISSDPMLAPLANNGGLTQTHALLEGSPAIDAGNNSLDLSREQRGAGFARVLGTGADIGAFETDPERIFTNGFEG